MILGRFLMFPVDCVKISGFTSGSQLGTVLQAYFTPHTIQDISESGGQANVVLKDIHK